MSDEEKLADVLEDILDDQLKIFKWHLRKERWNDQDPIKPTKLENADRLALVDLMVQKYQVDGAVVVMVAIFRKISRNDLAKKLQELFPVAPAASSGSPADAPDAVEKLLAVRANVVNKISLANLQQLLDIMLERKILNDNELEFGNVNRGEKARQVIDMVRKKGPKSSSALIEALCEVDPCLAEELKLK